MSVTRVLRFKRTITVAMAIALAGGIAASVVLYYVQQARLEEQRKELRAEYAASMRSALHNLYLIMGRVPEEVDEVTVGNPRFRNPDIMRRAEEIEGDRIPGGGIKVMLALELRAFDDVTPIPPKELEEWHQEYQQIKDFIEQAGSRENKLRLAADMKVDPGVWLQYSHTLTEADGVPQDLVNEYVDAAFEMRRIRQQIPTVGEQEAARLGIQIQGPPRVIDALENAEIRFEESVHAILDTFED